MAFLFTDCKDAVLNDVLVFDFGVIKSKAPEFAGHFKKWLVISMPCLNIFHFIITLNELK